MNVESKLAKAIEKGEFLVTAELLPQACGEEGSTRTALTALGGRPVAVNVADNQRGVALSSLAASVVTLKAGAEPILQMVTRDRNRIALQSDALGAVTLGIRNILCLSGYHQTVMGVEESANVFDLDSTQLVALLTQMAHDGRLADGTKLAGGFSVLVGAVANPFLKPLELNLLRLSQKIAAGARFIQTCPVFDVVAFKEWFEAARAAGITRKAAILAGVLPLESAEEGQRLRERYTDHVIPEGVLGRLKAAGQNGAQKKAGLALCAELIQQLKAIEGLGGVHLFSGGQEGVVPEILAASGLSPA
jgi:methylenetetrahydrofolate reductase (NADPH)